MNLDKYNKKLKDTPLEVKEDVRLSMDILERLHELLKLKFDGKQKALADRMGKSEAEISKLLSGIQNYTTKTLIKFQIAFGEPIIAVCTKSEEESTYELVKLSPQIKHTTVEVECNGRPKEISTKYEDFIPTTTIIETKELTNHELPI